MVTPGIFRVCDAYNGWLTEQSPNHNELWYRGDGLLGAYAHGHSRGIGCPLQPSYDKGLISGPYAMRPDHIASEWRFVEWLADVG